MKTANQNVQKVALPAFLRKGLDAFRMGQGREQKYLVRSRWKGQTYEFKPWQFYVLEVLPGCDDFTKLASVFEDRFGKQITEKEVEELFASVADRGLFGETAISQPMLASLNKERKIQLGRAASGISLTNPKPESHPSPGAAARSSTTEVADTLGIEDSVNEKEEEKSYLVKAMQKGNIIASFNKRRTTQLGENPPEDSFQGPAAKGIPSAARKIEPQPESVAPPVTSPLAEPLPAGVLGAVGLDNTMRKKGWKLFNPTWLIKLFYPLLSPFKYTIYLLPLALIAALFIVGRHSDMIAGDFMSLLGDKSFIKHALISMVTVNLSATLVTAMVAYAYHATVSGLCIVFFVLFFPRFMARIENVRELSRHERIWLHAAPLLLRLWLFSAGILVWFMTRTSHEVLAYLGLTIALAGAISFFITLTPFVKSNGYHLVAALLNEPHLRGKSFKALFNKFRSNVYRKADNNVLVAYALVSMVYMVAISAAMLYIFGRFLKIYIGMASMSVIAFIALVLIWRMIVKFKEIDRNYEQSIQFERWRKRTLPQIENEAVQKERPNRALRYLSRSVFILILAAMFLPYNYEPGGDFIVLPNEQQTITAEVAGIIEKINYDGGEILKEGTVIGQLSHSDYLAQVKIYDAKIKEQQAVINELKAKPKAEEVQLAQAALETQKTQAQFSKGKAERLETLYKEGVVSYEELDDARRKYQVDLDQIQEKTANLELVKSGATPDEIAAAEAKLQSYQEERDYYQQKIDESVLYMPFDGKLITMHLKQKIGSYLNKGEPLAVVEKTNQVIVEIEVPETDISYVKEKASIRVRPFVYHDEDFYGVVTSIDSNVTEERFGKVVKVVTLLENPDERLKSGMTGYAKITGEVMPVWKVASLAIIRFIKVEVWSWLP